MEHSQEQIEFLQDEIDKRLSYGKAAAAFTVKFGIKMTRFAVGTLVFRGRLKSPGRPVIIAPRVNEAAQQRMAEVFERHKLGQPTEDIAHAVGLDAQTVRSYIVRECRKRGEKRVYASESSRKAAMAGRKGKLFRKKAQLIDDQTTPAVLPHAPSYAPPVTFDQLDKIPLGGDEICMCRHYVGNPNDSLFCGRPSVVGWPYCEPHAMVAYRAPNARPRDDKRAAYIKKTAASFLAWRRGRPVPMREAA
jgi:hypothetical protein